MPDTQFNSGILFGSARQPDYADVFKRLAEAQEAVLLAVGKLQKLVEFDLLTKATANLATSISGARVAAVGTAGPGTEVYRNSTKKSVAVIVRDRGGTAQTLSAARQSSMDPADGVSTSGTTGVTTKTDPFIVPPNGAVYVRMSTTAVMVDVAILDVATLALER